MVPYLHMIACSCLNKARCLGYNVTSPAESMNNMIKKGLPDKTLSLVESRIEFQHIFDNHAMLTEEKAMSTRVPNNSIIHMQYWPAIANQIQQLIKDHEEYFIHKAYPVEFPKEIYRLNEWDCDCGFFDFQGMPCSHIIALTSLL